MRNLRSEALQLKAHAVIMLLLAFTGALEFEKSYTTKRFDLALKQLSRVPIGQPN
jgi:hypothetical protein